MRDFHQKQSLLFIIINLPSIAVLLGVYSDIKHKEPYAGRLWMHVNTEKNLSFIKRNILRELYLPLKVYVYSE